MIEKKVSYLPVKVAVIGLGWVTTHRHLPTMKANPAYHILGLVDRNAERARLIAADYGISRFTDAEKLSEIPWFDQVDAVTIGTSPGSHYMLAKEALNLGKHVLTEKPFAMKPEEGEELLHLAEAKGLQLGVVHNFQFSSCTEKLLDDLQNNRFGKIKAVIAQQFSNPRRRLPPWYDQLPLGLFYDESPHFFYLISRLAPGPLQLLTCNVVKSTLGMITPALVNILYQSKSPAHGTIPVTVNMNFEATVSEWHITVLGEHFLGDIDIFRDIYIRLPNDGLHTTRTVFRTSLMASWQHWAQHFTKGFNHLRGALRYGNDIVFQRFASAISTGDSLQNIGGKDALQILNMQHEVLTRHQTFKTL